MTTEKPAADGGGHRISILEWRRFSKNTLEGFCSVELPSGLILHGLTVHRKESARWIGLPGKPFAKQDGSTSWAPVIEIKDRGIADRIRDAVLAALDEHLGGEG